VATCRAWTETYAVVKPAIRPSRGGFSYEIGVGEGDGIRIRNPWPGWQTVYLTTGPRSRVAGTPLFEVIEFVRRDPESHRGRQNFCLLRPLVYAGGLFCCWTTDQGRWRNGRCAMVRVRG